MKKTEFLAEKSKLTVTRTFDAPLELVWRAWTEAELLDQWWAPKPWKSKTKHMNFKEGGTRLYAMIGPENEEHWGITTYTSINHPETFAGEDAFCDKNGIINNSYPIAKFENHFKENSQRTTVTIVTEYASIEQLEQVVKMGMKEGLSMAFDNLDDVLKNVKR